MSITIKVSDLFKLVKDLRHDGMDFVELIFTENEVDSEDYDDDYPPTNVGFTAFSRKLPDMDISYDAIYKADVSEFRSDGNDTDISYSSNIK